ncbi:putative O-glycosylation ligase, exosortase A system-associated [Sedimenticola selenatireducens]|uniref:Putative O-glycosylation ligase, exosortase A system-associated n=1 Tax=Sedimenticola selenatireducens TaxID=191960 RepID=A0A2N6D051_9GAMM|nr:putative O-glycosylation ligase, exosortase A system-associated [Sedimenticola selenatireducens]PLX63042.1 MAG: putative O-glycosylation ligase, exosortase A system-associated [Sedimenticola selenatireducens]
MRDIILTLIVFGSLPFILRNAYVGVLVWSWLSYMNPHRFTWGFAYSFPFAQVVAVVLLIATLLSKEKKSLPITGLTIFCILFILWMGFTTLFALQPESALVQLIKVVKIQLIIFFTLMLIHKKEQVIALLWVIVGSIGFFGIKGGLFTILTAGAFRVWGPPGSFIEDNNELAVALLMLLPLIYYLKTQVTHIWAQRGLILVMLLCGLSVFASYSRGAFLTIGVMSLYLLLKTKNKVIILTLLFICGFLVLSFLPSQWHERISTIQEYEQDASAMGRINAWTYSVNVANDRLTGGGFNSWSTATFRIYAPNPTDVHAAHSIYFGVLGDHGWIGLLLFLMILLLAWRTGVWVRKNAKGIEELKWAYDFAYYFQISMVAYCAGGAFLSLAYFDFPWHLFAIILIVKKITEEQLETLRQQHSYRQSSSNTPHSALATSSETR